MQLIVRHVGRRIASSRGHQGSIDVCRLINGLKIGQRYKGEDRLIALTTAARSAAGRAFERLEVVPLPPPVAWDDIDRWVRMFSHDVQSGRIERCLFTACQEGHEQKILPLLFECAVEPFFLGFADNLISLGYLSEVIEVFSWNQSAELAANLGAKLVGRGRGEPDQFRRDAVKIMTALAARIEGEDGPNPEVDEEAVVSALVSVDVKRSFEAVADALKSGANIDRLITTMVLLAADRMARTPVNVDAGWGELTTELNAAAALRRFKKYGGDAAAARGLFHGAWEIFHHRWLRLWPKARWTRPTKTRRLQPCWMRSTQSRCARSAA